MLTAEQIAKLEELGFKHTDYFSMPFRNYETWKKEIFAFDGEPCDAIIEVHLIDGNFRNVASMIEEYTNDKVRSEYQHDLEELRKVGIK